MTRDAWQFQTTNGVVTVESDAIRVQSSPGQILAGQRTRWRAEGSVERAKTVLWVVFLCFFPIGFIASIWNLVNDGLASSGFVWTLFFSMALIASLHTAFRDTIIPLESIQRISLEQANRKLVVEYTPGSPLSRFMEMASLATKTGNREYVLASDEEVRNAREVFSLRGISLEDGPSPTGTEPTGFVVEDGLYFCESCRRQVSPTDRTCPACDYRLRSEPGSSSKVSTTAEV